MYKNSKFRKNCNALHSFLNLFTVEACRILCNVRLRRCPLLTKLAISQCPKIDAVTIARDLGRLPAKRNRIMFVQPFISSDNAGEVGMLPAQFPQV